MPVELPDLTPSAMEPKPPKAITWLVLFAVFMLAGVGTLLLTTPKGASTHTTWFWLRLDYGASAFY